MNAQAFWQAIASYNQSTIIYQCVFMTLIFVGFIFALFQKTTWFPKIALGLANLFIGVVFFLVFGTEPIQYYFAAPLFIATGFLLIYEAIKRKSDIFTKPNKFQWFLLFLFLIYPFVSLLLGNAFPKMVVYIMPCPVISVSIVIYSCYKRKNKLLLILLAIWGITGIKAFFVNAFEDVILLLCGFYCMKILITDKISEIKP